MTDERICVICGRRPYERAQVCWPDRGRLPHILADIADLYLQLPEVLERGQAAGQRVSGSREAPVPVSLDVVDLSASARIGNATAQAKRNPDDQIGHISVPSILDAWVRDWRDEMAFAQSLPLPTVPELVRWLRDRIEWACDRHPAVDEFAAEMVKTRGILRSILGLTESEPDFCDGVVCKSCDRMALYRDGQYVECDACGLLYTEAEYNEWVALLEGQVKCPECGVKVARAVRGKESVTGVIPLRYHPCGHMGRVERMAA